MMRWSFALVCAVVLLLIQPTRALACSCDRYANHFYADDGGSIPINGRGLLWLTDDPAPSESLTVWRVRDGKLEPLAVELVKLSPETDIIPKRPDLYLIEVSEREVGDRLRFEAKQHGEDADRPALQVEVTVAPPVDEQAGPWTLHARRKLFRVIGTAAVMQCYARIGAVTLDLDLDLELPDALADMRGAFLYQTFVDGAPWKPAHSLCAPRVLGRSWRDVIGSDRVYVGCNQRADQFRRWSGAAQADPGLPSGRHEAYVVASLPIPGLEFRSNTVEFELRCGRPYETNYEGPPASKAGCSVADGKSPSSLALVFGLLTLGCLLGARKRGRTRV